MKKNRLPIYYSMFYFVGIHMEVIVYNTETFTRSRRWYIFFAIVIAGVCIVSLLNDNIVGAILIFFLLGGYCYYSVVNSQSVKMSITSTALLVGDKTYARGSLSGFVIEIHAKTHDVKNIVLLSTNNKTHIIHTFHDDQAQIKNFVETLADRLPLTNNYNQSFLEKVGRRLQL